MYSTICRNGFYLCSAVVAPTQVKNALEERKESGWDRVKKIFEVDDSEGLSPEMSHIYHTTVLTGLVGAGYGGFIHSRDAYLTFIENNDATKFADHFEAKKKLQDYVTTNFAKGALRWSWRLALFGGMYTTGVSILSAYRGSASLIDFVLSGLVSGALYRINYGLNAVIVGGTLGSFVGLLAGCGTMMILRFSRNTYDDINQWHKQQSMSRERHFEDAKDKALFEGHENTILVERDKKMNVL